MAERTFSIGLVIGVLSLWGRVAIATPVCYVADPELQGDYLGQCDAQGRAEGLAAVRGSASYVGEFHEGKKQGKGVKVWAWGDRYVGEFHDDAKSGYGVYEFGPNSPWAGDRYLGEYAADQREGLGVYEWASGEKYQGQWSHDIMVGPPTSMALLRGYRLKAVQDAVMIVGLDVCRVVTGEDKMPTTLRGNVVGLNKPLSIGVRFSDDYVVAGKHISKDSVAWENAMDWLPCK